MKIELNDASQLLEMLISGHLTFKDKKSSRFLVNAIGNYCANYCDETFSDFNGYSEADDISDHLNEMFSDWDFDWFDILTFTFDVEEVTNSLLMNESISYHYTYEVAVLYVEEHLSNWARKVEKMIAQTMNNQVETH